jgi:GH18 family chitinase
MLHEVTHVALAFMRSEIFNSEETPTEWPLFTTVAETRAQFHEGTAIQVAVGGWGDTAPFEKAALTDASRKTFARNMAAMVQATGADGKHIMS